jgi:hypothetical protein
MKSGRVRCKNLLMGAERKKDRCDRRPFHGCYRHSKVMAREGSRNTVAAYSDSNLDVRLL